MTYPPAPRSDLVETLHGHPVADPYRWLEDASSQTTRAWSQAQEDLYAEHAATWPGRARAATRIGELLASGMIGVPIWRGERRFQMRREPTQEHAVLLVEEPGPDGVRSERVLIDPMAIDPSGLTTLDTWQPSKEGDLLAYQISTGGTEESVLRVIEVATGTEVDGPIDRARYSPVAFLPGGQAYYYVRRLAPDGLPEAEQQLHRRVYLHRLGTDPDTDVEIFGAGQDIRSYYGVSVSREGHWLTVSAATGTAPRNDLWIAGLDAETGDGTVLEHPELRPITVGLDAQTDAAVGRDGRLYITTDLDAPRRRVAVTDPLDPGPETWRDLLVEGGPDGDAVLEDAAILDGEELAAPLLLAAWTRHAVSELTVHDLATGEHLPGERGRVALPGLGSLGGIVERPEGGPVVWFGCTDHTMPQHIYSYDGRTGATTLFASPPGAVPRVDVVTRQVACTSVDGTTVRMFVITRNDARDGTAGPRPTILYGYGGFGVSLTPAYSASILAWVEAGGAYVIANLRGGSEEGEAWHRAGMLADKHHVFEDFEAAAQWLLDQGITTTHQLCISGGSNGGLLVGAALTRRPDLYQAVVCSAPLLDMVRYELFGLGVTWNVEYGSASVAEEFGWLLSYSPYHQVRPDTAYPATLFTVFDGDTRVDTLHARKLCAALQHATSSDRPILYRCEKDVGHGARALSRSIALSAETMAFAAHQTGLELG
ncbi:MAG: prolyl oligopeptidase family serine peptidase [Kineosporiaceae bacterium]